MKDILIKNARVVSPADGIDSVCDILVQSGRIAQIAENISADAPTFEAGGLIACPGFVDMHVHLRDPGYTHKEDILTGTQAAAAGGFTGVVCMPNTNPTIDTAETVQYILNRAKDAKARVYPVGSITNGLRGEVFSDYAALKNAGAVAVSDDGRPVENAAVMQSAMAQCYALGLPVISHCEDLNIIAGGIMNRGRVSQELGVKGMDRSSEDSITAREIALAEADGTAIHIAHVSTRGAVAIIRDAKRRGAKVTCESAPHYMLLTDEALRTRDANFRMNPPLREESDRLAIIEGFVDGTIDAIITDHAPHSPEEKACFETAPNGIIGLETCFAAACTALVASGRLEIGRLVELMSTAPCRILGIPGGRLRVGDRADITLFDPAERWVFTKSDIVSKSSNTPFIGAEFTGRVHCTIMDGEITYKKQ